MSTFILYLYLLIQNFAVKAASLENENTDLRKTTNVVSHMTDISFAVLSHDPQANLPSSFTICSTIMAPNIRTRVLVFFNILDEVANLSSKSALSALIRITDTMEGPALTFNWEQQWKKLENNGEEFHAFSHQWIKSCAAYNLVSGLYQVVADGILVVNSTIPHPSGHHPGLGNGNISKDLSGRIFFGAYQSNGNWIPVSNKVTNLNIFSTAHSAEVMRQNTKGGKCIEDGDYLAWKDMEWTLIGGAIIETVDMEEPCKEDPLVDVYDTKSGPERIQSMESCMQLCENLRSRSPSITTIEEWDIVYKFFKAYENPVPDIWVAINDNQLEGEWRDYYTGQVMNHTQAWAQIAPNGKRNENCALLFKSTDGLPVLEDDHCEGKHFCMCKRQPRMYLKLRGLCNNSAIDTYYKPMNNPNEIWKLKLIGLQTAIEHDASSGLWKLSVVESNVTAASKTSLASYTLGRHNWTISGDKGCNENINSDTYTTELKLSSCQKGQFTCNDGQCVGMDHRCDQLPHCRDTSDEMGCDILILKNGYNMNIPPIKSENGLKIPVDVNTSIDIFKLVDINEEDYSIEIQFQITLEWTENRVTYQNLKFNDSLNALAQKDIKELWLPEVIYENTDQKDTTRLGVAWEWKRVGDSGRDQHFSR